MKIYLTYFQWEYSTLTILVYQKKYVKKWMVCFLSTAPGPIGVVRQLPVPPTAPETHPA